MKKVFVSLFVFALSAFWINAEAQKNDSCQHRYIGIGIHASVFQVSEINRSVMPPNRLLLSVDPLKYLRIEGQYGIYKNMKDEPFTVFSNPQTTVTVHLKEGSTVAGVGLFGVCPVDKAKFLIGLRYCVDAFKQDNVQYLNGPSPVVSTDSDKINIIAGVLGAEYLFSKWFSVGGEFSLLGMNDKYTSSGSSSPASIYKTSITESSIIVRFYPY